MQLGSCQEVTIVFFVIYYTKNKAEPWSILRSVTETVTSIWSLSEYYTLPVAHTIWNDVNMLYYNYSLTTPIYTHTRYQRWFGWCSMFYIQRWHKLSQKHDLALQDDPPPRELVVILSQSNCTARSFLVLMKPARRQELVQRVIAIANGWR